MVPVPLSWGDMCASTTSTQLEELSLKAERGTINESALVEELLVVHATHGNQQPEDFEEESVRSCMLHSLTTSLKTAMPT